MSRLLELYSTYLGPASDTLLDLGSTSFRWKNIYLSGSINTVLSDSGNFSALVSSRMTVDSATVTTLIVSNGSRATLNTIVLQQTALTVQNNDVWFMSSSNQMYLFCRSNNINFYIAMGTTNAYPAL